MQLGFEGSVGAAAFLASLNIARAPKRKTTTSTQNPLAPLLGKSFVFTGEAASRTGFEREVQRLGGKVTSAVSSRTAYVVVYDTTTVKYRKACDLRDAGKRGPQILTDDTSVRALLDAAAATHAEAASRMKEGGASSAQGASSSSSPSSSSSLGLPSSTGTAATRGEGEVIDLTQAATKRARVA